MPCLKLLRPLATSPIMFEKRLPPNNSNTTIAKIKICQMLKPPMGVTPSGVYLVRLFGGFQLKLEDALVERIEQAGGFQIVDSGQVAARSEPEMREELLRRC